MYADLKQIFINCLLYNVEGSAIYDQALQLERYLYEEVLKEPLPEKNASSHHEGKKKNHSKIPANLIAAARKVLSKISSQPYSYFFNTPVDPARDGVPDYLHVIKNPMDLGTIRIKLDTNEYQSIDEFERDVDLVFSNCFMYNKNPKTIVHQVLL